MYSKEIVYDFLDSKEAFIPAFSESHPPHDARAKAYSTKIKVAGSGNSLLYVLSFINPYTASLDAIFDTFKEGP